MLLFLKFCATPIHPKLALQMIPIPFIQSYFQRSAPAAPMILRWIQTHLFNSPLFSKVRASGTTCHPYPPQIRVLTKVVEAPIMVVRIGYR